MKFSITTAGSGAGLLALIATLSTVSLPGGEASAIDDAPEVIELTGIVRDFKAYNVTGGHSDFEKQPTGGYGHYVGNIAPYLSSEGKPVFVGGGHKVTRDWKDANGNPICYLLYNVGLPQGAAPDTAGAVSSAVDSSAITSAESFDQWFKDVPGVNMSKPLTLTLVKQADGSYVFDDKEDPLYKSLGGFFPIEGQLFGNSGLSPNRNFHFTFELHTTFTHDESANHYFKFIGDDDVWVFINGQLVIDLGGVHSALTQHVALNRLGLTDGETYTLSFFFAERHTTQSNFRIATTLPLVSTRLPSVTAAYD